MAVTIDATVGGASANSFVTLAEATAYMQGRLNASAWDAASGDSQNRALVEATRELTVRSWLGNTVTSAQALAWPREWVTNPDDPNLDYYDSDVIPQRVKDACCELAFQFIKAGTSDVAALDGTDGVLEETVDVLTTRYDVHAKKQGLERYPRVMLYIRPLLAAGYGVIRSTVRG